MFRRRPNTCSSCRSISCRQVPPQKATTMNWYMKVSSALLTVLALLACRHENPEAAHPGPVPVTFTAISEPASRTSLGGGGSVLWSSSDAITLFDGTGSAGSTFKVASISQGGAVATFTGLSPQSADGYSYALSPASSSARLTDASGVISAELPTVQTGVEGSFPAEAALAVARVDPSASADSDILHFRNVGAILSFTIPGNYITRVRIESRDKSVAMSGPASIRYNDGVPVAEPSAQARNYVEVLVPSGTIGKRYYAAVYPGNYSSGFYVTFYTAVNYYNRYTSSLPLELGRNANVLLIDRNWIQNDDRDTATESGYEQVTPGPVEVRISGTAENYYNFIVNYTIEGVSSTGAEHGLVLSYDYAEPTCGLTGAEGKLPGPVLTGTGTARLMQCVPNSILRVGQPCYIRAYCYDSQSGSYAYSPVCTLTLPAQPEGSSIVRTGLDSPAAGIDLFSFKADGSINGFCAKANASSGVRLRVNNAPMGRADAISMGSQSASCGAQVLLNGQIFGSQGNIGLAYSSGELRYNNYSSEGIANCRGYSNSYTTDWQPVTRAILGVDASGRPDAYWCSLIDGKAYFFDRPIPAGSAVYPQVTASSGPGPARAWAPGEALSTGPMLLYDGKVCVSEDRISTGVYYTNYELWETTPQNIYGSSRHRSAIGYDSATGDICLVAVPSNVTITRMALIMKGLGCDYAMNLDGGGSTQMYVAGSGELTPNERKVKSTVGFFAP